MIFAVTNGQNMKYFSLGFHPYVDYNVPNR